MPRAQRHRHPLARLDGRDGARHGRAAQGGRRPEAELLRLLVRDVPRRPYAALFPNRFRALVLDGPLDADEYLSDPLKGSNEQTAAFERELSRFFRACAAHQDQCLNFGQGDDPEDAYDALIDRANATPIPALGYPPDPRPVDGDDINAVAVIAMYAKQSWPFFAEILAAAEANDGTLVRALVDEAFYGRDPDTGTFDPITDRFFAIYGAEAHWPSNIPTYVREGEQAWGCSTTSTPTTATRS